jgi:hypothetical protein
MSANIAHFAHDLAEPAVQRRVRALDDSAVLPIGFRRGAKLLATIDLFRQSKSASVGTYDHRENRRDEVKDVRSKLIVKPSSLGTLQ